MMFDYLDYKPVDNLITGEELSEAFKDFSMKYKITIRLAENHYFCFRRRGIC